MKTDNWPKNDRIDWILFGAQLENIDFGDRILKFERTNPQVYVRECTDAIFSAAEKRIRHTEETGARCGPRASKKYLRC